MDGVFEFNDNEIHAENKSGNIKISNDVVAAIAAISAEEVKGVAGMYTTISDAIAEKIAGKKNKGKGVKITINETGISVDLTIVADFGVRLRDISESVQKNVRRDVETMTGMSVTEVNVRVESVKFIKTESQPDVEIIEED